MAPKFSEDEIDDLIYFARAGEASELNDTLATLSSREAVTPADILTAAKDTGKSTCLHMATGNGNLGKQPVSLSSCLPACLAPASSPPLPLTNRPHLEIVTLLLSHFSTAPKELKLSFLDAPNEFGNTGLHWASMGGHLDVVKFLIGEGASPALANDKNYIPLDLASFAEKMNVVDYFLAQVRELENENGGDGLGNATGAVELGDDAEAETEETEAAETEDVKPSGSS